MHFWKLRWKRINVSLAPWYIRVRLVIRLLINEKLLGELINSASFLFIIRQLWKADVEISKSALFQTLSLHQISRRTDIEKDIISYSDRKRKQYIQTNLVVTLISNRVLYFRQRNETSIWNVFSMKIKSKLKEKRNKSFKLNLQVDPNSSCFFLLPRAFSSFFLPVCYFRRGREFGAFYLAGLVYNRARFIVGPLFGS